MLLAALLIPSGCPQADGEPELDTEGMKTDNESTGGEDDRFQACLPEGAAVIVQTGDPAPGGAEGATFQSFGLAPVIGPEGTVAFTGYAASSPADEPAHGLWWHNGGTTIEPVAFAGEPLPVAGNLVPNFIVGSPVISRGQVVGFQVVTDAGDAAVLAWNAVFGEVELLGQEGQPVGPAGEPLEGVATFQNAVSRAAHDERTVFAGHYVAEMPTECFQVYGLWTAGPSPLALCGDVAPSFDPEVLIGAYEPEVRTNEHHHAAAILGLTSEAGGDAGLAVYRWNLASGGAPDLVHQLPPAATANGPTSMRLLRLNAAGTVAFVEEGSGVPGAVRVFPADGGFLLPVLGDQPAPGFEGSLIGRITGLALLGDDRVVVSTTLRSGPADGIGAVFWQSSATDLSLVAHDGMAVPGQDGVRIDTIEQVHVNDADQMLLRVFLTGDGINPANDQALLGGTGGNLELLLQTGTPPGCDAFIGGLGVLSDQIPSQPTEVYGPGQGGAPRGIDRAGRVPVYVRYDGSEAIVVLSLPS